MYVNNMHGFILGRGGGTHPLPAGICTVEKKNKNIVYKYEKDTIHRSFTKKYIVSKGRKGVGYAPTLKNRTRALITMYTCTFVCLSFFEMWGYRLWYRIIVIQ